MPEWLRALDLLAGAETQEKGMVREFTVIIERDEEGYLVGSVPALRGCHTQAKSMDELLKRMKEAIQLCIEVEGEEAVAPLDLVGVQRLAV
jgi:predicted RNase H-like HicB family nuclease